MMLWLWMLWLLHHHHHQYQLLWKESFLRSHQPCFLNRVRVLLDSIYSRHRICSCQRVLFSTIFVVVALFSIDYTALVLVSTPRRKPVVVEVVSQKRVDNDASQLLLDGRTMLCCVVVVLHYCYYYLMHWPLLILLE